jgi:peptidoglycan/xylan/chitin deacetylase (PgdA/CDA1 family)
MPPARRPGVAATAVAVTAAGVAAALRAGLGPTSQLFGAFPYRGDTTAPTVALTFDDGPNEPYTSQVLDTLADRGVPATFFQVGRCARRHPGATRRVVAEGHVLGNHSESHTFSRYASDPTQRRELERGRATLREVSGRTPLLYRPPWLCHWPWVLRGIARTGSQVVSGTFAHPLEVLQPRPEVLVAGALARVRPGTILILHDGREARGGFRGSSAAAVGPLVDRLRERGYSFTTVDRLLGVAAYAPAPS